LLLALNFAFYYDLPATNPSLKALSSLGKKNAPREAPYGWGWSCRPPDYLREPPRFDVPAAGAIRRVVSRVMSVSGTGLSVTDSLAINCTIT
jgi:hypothetical protein